MRRLAYVANSPVPSRRASTAHVLNMSAGFAEAGADVTLIARGDPSAAGQALHDFALPATFDMRLQPHHSVWLLDRLRFIRRIRSILAHRRFDLVYGRSCYGLLGGVPGHVPFGYDLHAFPALARQRRLESLLFRRSNFVFATAISKALADGYVDAYPSLAGRVLVAPCAARGPAAAPRWGKRRAPGALRVYYVGHLYPGRGIDFILELARAEPDIEFHIVGGEDADIAFWTGQAPANVRFHGYVKPASLGSHFERADVCIAPYGTGVAVAGGGNTALGMSPMKMFEYMSYGKPIVSSDLPVLREIVDDGVDALLCPPADLACWRAALASMQVESRRDALGRAARAKFESRFSWEQRARSILAFAEALMPRPTGRAATRLGT